jgi:hypothetical protein
VPEHIPKNLLQAKDLGVRGALPHHQEIAVDEASQKSNKLYDATEFARQFRLRRQTAIEQIRARFGENWS